VEWYLRAFRKYSAFRGRARRKEYWIFHGVNLLVLWLLAGLESRLGLDGSNCRGPLVGIFQMVVLVPGMAVAVRRMHDTGHSGWWALVPIQNIAYAATRGTTGPNRFGRDPKASEAA